MHNIDKVIELSEKKTGLLKELKQSQIYETCDYHVVPTPGRVADFMLFEIATQKEVRNGNAQYIRTWLDRRKIPNEKVYHYYLIEYKEPVKVEDTGFRVNNRITKRLQ